MTRQTSSSILELRAECEQCEWASDAANALGNAARHHDAGGHTVVVKVTRVVIYGDPHRPLDGQVQLEDVGEVLA